MGRISPRSGRMATAGVQLKEILDAFAHSEWLADWDEGVVTHGEGMCPGLLSRTDAQRLFTGPLREAVLPWSNAGPTSTANGDPMCGHHNRWKSRGWRAAATVVDPLGVEHPDVLVGCS